MYLFLFSSIKERVDTEEQLSDWLTCLATTSKGAHVIHLYVYIYKLSTQPLRIPYAI